MIRFFILLMLSVTHLFSVKVINNSDWTKLYRKTFADTIRATNAGKKMLIFSQDSISPFTQLIFSWNALRPQVGHFSFFAQVRDAETKRWGDWHKMVEWGNNVQKSYTSKSDGVSSYAHVRLEIDKKKQADGFRIKVEPHDAHLGLLYGLSAAASHFDLFKSESSAHIIPQMKTVILDNIPQIAQLALDHEDNHRICSPVSCAMVVQYLTGLSTNPLDFATGVFDAGLSVYGSWGCNVAHAFDWCKGAAYFFVRRCNSFIDLHRQLMRGIPSVVSVRGPLPGALKPFAQGHLMVVMGWDQQAGNVVCHDPAADTHDTVLKRYPLEDFLRAWERSHRLTYTIEPIVKLRITHD